MDVVERHVFVGCDDDRARVIDRDLDGPEPRLDLRHEIRDGRRIGHVAHARQHALRSAEGEGGSFDLPRIARTDRYLGPAGEKRAGDRESESAGAAGDERRLAGEERVGLLRAGHTSFYRGKVAPNAQVGMTAPV